MNRLHVYTGKGKGKTTAAMGLALRSLGHDNRVLIGQFMKDGCSGELAALRQFPNALVAPCKPLKGFVALMKDGERESAAQEQSAYALQLIKTVKAFEPQTVILDELGVALELHMLDEAAARELIEVSLQYAETAVTGCFVPAWLLDRADYISRIEPDRHPYETENLPARQGVEW